MKWFKKICLVIGALVVAAQIPGIYRRIVLEGVSSEIERLDKTRSEADVEGFREYRGVIHIHSKIGGDSTGTIETIADAAGQNDLDFVVMTEHTSNGSDTSTQVFSGLQGNVLFLSGHEMDSRDGNRYLIIDSFPGVSEAGELPAKELIKKVNDEGSLAFVTHPERNSDLQVRSDGFEVFSIHTSIKKVSPVPFLLDALWSYWKYPQLTMLSHFVRPDEKLKQYDELADVGPLSLFGSTDAHSNLGLKLGSDQSHPWIDIKLDPYDEVFRLVRTHLFLRNGEKLTNESVIEALKSGRFYNGLDALGNSDGFVFQAAGGGSKFLMGNEVELSEDLILSARSPLPARFVVFRDGKRFWESGVTSGVEIPVGQKGVYRVELYQDGLGKPFDKLPWIMSNPIYVQ